MSAPAPAARRLRVLAFSSIDLSLRAGHAMHVLGSLDALAERGHEVELITPRPAGRVPATRFRLRSVPLLRFRILGPWSFEVLGACVLLARAWRLKPDLIWTRQDLYTLAPSAMARLLRVPVVVEVNSSIPDELAALGKRSARAIAASCERWSLGRASRVVVLSAELGERLARRLPTLRDRIRVAAIATHVPAPADPREVRSLYGIEPSTFLVGFAGNLTPIQGVSLLLDAWAGAETGSDALLAIVGSGTAEADLRERARPLGARVRFFGAMDRAQADALLAASQVLVAPYRRDLLAQVTGGAVSTKLLTYLAADRPVVVPDLEDFAPLAASNALSFYDAEDPASLSSLLLSFEARWRAAACPLVDWPWERPGPGRRFVLQGRTWLDRAVQVEEIVEPLLPEGRTGQKPASA